MKLINSLIGGFAGAIALNILHETVKHFYDKAPRVDLVGEEALEKYLHTAGMDPPQGNQLYLATLAGDVISNGLYFSAIGMGNTKRVFWKGALSGITAGIGAVKLPSKMGLDDTPVTYTNETKTLTIGWYLFGGLVAAAVIRKLEGKKSF